jgi:hypothetical protein
MSKDSSYAVYKLTDDEKERLMREVNGRGGIQTFLIRLQKSVEGDTLSVSQRDFEWLSRNWEFLMRDDGGWQQRIPKEFRDDALEFAVYV